MQITNRNKYANDLSTSIIEFMNIHYGFIMNCMTSSDRGVIMNSDKYLLKKIDILGREVGGDKNMPILNIYDDGTVEKKIILE